MRVWAAALWIASFLAATVAVAAELQVPLDLAGRVQRIDAALAHRLRMFADRPDFCPNAFTASASSRGEL